jgi:hypothetical protein
MVLGRSAAEPPTQRPPPQLVLTFDQPMTRKWDLMAAATEVAHRGAAGSRPASAGSDPRSRALPAFSDFAQSFRLPEATSDKPALTCLKKAI